MFSKRILNVLLAVSLCSTAQFLSTSTSQAHPHVFAEANLELLSNDVGGLEEIRHVWRFDEFFSASVLIDFDANSNLKLDPEELEEIGQVVHKSLAEFGYYTELVVDGQSVAMAPPDMIITDYVDDQLLMFFAMSPAHPLKLEGKISVGVFDPTFYASIDFLNDTDLNFTGPHENRCKKAVVRPDPDEVLTQNQGSLTDAFYDDQEDNDISKLFATRLEVTC
jgi:ABC-type uncharacterized transport system substrate-binding protein